jgi:hypothetical protein
MTEANLTLSHSKLAHRVAVVWGVLAGMIMFGITIQELFSANGNDTLFGITTGVVGGFALLPLSSIAVSKPRAAAYGIALSSIFLAGNLSLMFFNPTPNRTVSLPGLAVLALAYLASPVGVARLLLYSTGGILWRRTQRNSN